MVKKKNGSMTLDKLAPAIAKSFADVQEKMSKGFADARGEADERFQMTLDEFARIRPGIRDIKGTVGPMWRMVNMQEEELSGLHLRVDKLERKVGLKD